MYSPKIRLAGTRDRAQIRRLLARLQLVNHQNSSEWAIPEQKKSKHGGLLVNHKF